MSDNDNQAMYDELARQLSDAELERDNALRAIEAGQAMGTVDGDVLVDILADATPDEWRMDASRAFAERVLASMVEHGFTVLCGPQSTPWCPPVVGRAA